MGRDVDAPMAARFGNGERESQNTTGDGMISPLTPLAGRTFAITVTIEGRLRGPDRKAVVLLTGDESNPYLTLAWH
jgi:hypothetical protein